MTQRGAPENRKMPSKYPCIWTGLQNLTMPSRFLPSRTAFRTQPLNQGTAQIKGEHELDVVGQRRRLRSPGYRDLGSLLGLDAHTRLGCSDTGRTGASSSVTPCSILSRHDPPSGTSAGTGRNSETERGTRILPSAASCTASSQPDGNHSCALLLVDGVLSRHPPSSPSISTRAQTTPTNPRRACS
jgi:hypothetical protein